MRAVELKSAEQDFSASKPLLKQRVGQLIRILKKGCISYGF